MYRVMYVLLIAVFVSGASIQNSLASEPFGLSLNESSKPCSKLNCKIKAEGELRQAKFSKYYASYDAVGSSYKLRRIYGKTTKRITKQRFNAVSAILENELGIKMECSDNPPLVPGTINMFCEYEGDGLKVQQFGGGGGGGASRHTFDITFSEDYKS